MHHLDRVLFNVIEDPKKSSDEKLSAVQTILSIEKRDFAKYQALQNMAKHLAASNKAAGFDAAPPVEPLPDINAKNEKGETSLLVAVKLKEAKIAEELICAKADLTVKDSKSKTLLTVAASNGDIKTVDVLMNCQSKDDTDFYDLMCRAIESGHHKLVQHLLKVGHGRYSPDEGSECLKYAAMFPDNA